ncbi:MAG: alpha/beta hydrolase [Nitrososphaeraceae archaeon]
MYYTKKSEEVQLRPLILSVIFLFVLIISTFTIVINTPLIYGQTNQTDNADLLNIQDISAKKVHVGDIDIAYKIFGRGNPILLISGSGNVMDVWPTHFLKELALNHTVIIFDNRGVGNTTAGTRPFSIDQFANDTVGLLDALDIQRTDVLGFSMASFIAQKITLTHPERVSRLVLYGASCGGREGIPQTQEVTMTISDLANNHSQNADASLSVTFPPEWIRKNPNYLETIPKTPEIILSTTVVKQFNAVEDWLSRNWTGVCDQLQHISIPTLIITGAEDVSVPAANSLILVQKIPGAWLVQIKAAGHGLMFQYPEKFSEIVKAFLSTTPN